MYLFTFNQVNQIIVFPVHVGVESASKSEQPTSNHPCKVKYFSLTG